MTTAEQTVRLVVQRQRDCADFGVYLVTAQGERLIQAGFKTVTAATRSAQQIMADATKGGQ